MYYSPVRHSSPKWSVRLACIRHAASVHPEPGSNSPLSYSFQTTLVCLALFYFLNLIDVVFYSFLFSFQCPLTWLSRRVPIYITIPSPFCKAFFLSFFVFFLYFPLFLPLYQRFFIYIFLSWLKETIFTERFFALWLYDFFTVQNDRCWSIIDQRDFHHRSKDSCFCMDPCIF